MRPRVPDPAPAPAPAAAPAPVTADFAAQYPTITLEALATQHPEMYEQFRREAMAAGAAAERTRQFEIGALGGPGLDALISECVADPDCSPADAAMRIRRLQIERAASNDGTAAAEFYRTYSGR
jgi:hypothetical protein